MNIFKHRIILGLIALVFGIMSAPAFSAPQSYSLDKSRSLVKFEYIVNATASSGVFPIENTNIVLDLQNLTRSSVGITLQIDKARAADIIATGAMRSANVLNADQFPRATFHSKQLTPRKHGAVVVGDLTLRGITNEVILLARLIREPNAPTDNSELFVHITGDIQRDDFGASGFPNLVGPTISLDILVRLVRD
jgi:polyisoprenoid-binding protein YceI